MNTKHTPGPWEWSGDALYSGTVEVLKAGDNGKPYGLHSAELQMENEAPDKALIVAAPELLRALEGMVMRMESESRRFPKKELARRKGFIDSAKAAIAKATGEAVS